MHKNIKNKRSLSKPNNKKSHSFLSAFTLAEVLITLGIIGVIAALTIPILFNTTDSKEAVSAVKKSYSTLSEAYLLSVSSNGNPDLWGMTAADSSIMFGKIIPFLAISKNCGTTTTGCFPTEDYKFLNGGAWYNFNSDTNWSKAVLSDGSLIAMSSSNNCNTPAETLPSLKTICGLIYVDINGVKKPNQLGLDVFHFYLTLHGIIPRGTASEVAETFADECQDKTSASGGGCAAWVLYNSNLDYTKCDDLSWNSKTTCD